MEESKRCAECGHAVSGQARFCELCGSALRTDNTPLDARGPQGSVAEQVPGERSSIEGERKQVTVMFVDIARSMELTRSLDNERWGVVLDRFLAIACGAIDELDGTTNQFTGDGLMAVFGAPLAREDHARGACLAALELHKRIAPFATALEQSDGVELSIRCGLSSGEVIVGSIGSALRLDFAPIGNISGLGQRMESLAPEGSTALTAHTAALVEDEFELRELGRFDVKGLSEPQHVYELLGPSAAGTPLETVASPGLSRFVGRGAERATLEAALERALAGEGGAVGVRGEPGVGKSRLVGELARHCRDRGLRIDAARAVAHGRTAPLLPVLEILRAFFGVDEGEGQARARERVEDALLGLDSSLEPDLSLLLDFLGLADPERPVEQIDPEARRRRLLSLVRRLVEVRSRREPAVIVIEDLHWMDAASAAYVEELARAVTGTRTLLVATFRPEYEAAWTESPAYEELPLAPLDSPASTELLAGLLGGDPSLGDLPERIREHTRGNPFFIEEVVRTMAESDRLAGERGSYRLNGPLEELALPPTVQAVIGARIDRLGPREKALLQTMSVIGQEIDRAVLREVAGLEASDLASALSTLTTAEFVVAGGADGSRDLAFKHPLTQEVTYASLLSEPRSRSHAAVAAAIESVYPDGLDERAALLAHHSEAGGETLQAARWHARAAVWVFTSSLIEGLHHWRRVRELADMVGPSPEAEQLARSARASLLAIAWRQGISREEAAAMHAEGQTHFGPPGTEAADSGVGSSNAGVLLDTAYAATVFWGGGEQRGFEIMRTASSAAEAIGDPELVMVTNATRGSAAAVMGLFRECVEVTDRSLSLAGDNYDAGSWLGVGNLYAICLGARASGAGALGDSDRASRDFDRALEIAAEFGAPEAESFVLLSRAGIYADQLESERALRDAERGVELAERAGANIALVGGYVALARSRGGCRDFEGALEAAERAIAVNREHGAFLTWEPDILCHLTVAKLGLGDAEGAREAAREAVAIAERRSLKRALVHAKLGLGRLLMATEGIAGGAVGEALGGARAVATEIGYRAIEPQIRFELAALAQR